MYRGAGAFFLGSMGDLSYMGRNHRGSSLKFVGTLGGLYAET